MTALRLFTGILTLAMGVTVVYGLAAGDFGDEGRAILDLAWGRVTLIDLYVGLALFGAWICVRDGGRRAFPWFVALVVLGNLAAAAYAFTAARTSDSVASFLLGRSEV